MIREIFLQLYRVGFWILLIVMAVEDHRTQEIHTWLPVSGIFAGAVLMAAKGIPFRSFAEAVVFCLLQLLVFARMYGFGDCLVFMMCALYLALCCGRGLLDDLLLMLVTYCLLTIAQLCRRNVHRGKLREPAAMIPYIAAAMALNVLCMKI